MFPSGMIFPSNFENSEFHALRAQGLAAGRVECRIENAAREASGFLNDFFLYN
jgi:hypothetical protein